MDKNIIFNKIESLRHCIERIKEKTPATPDELLENYDLQDIICLNLERAIQLCVDISAHIIAESNINAPTSMAESFKQLARLNFINDQIAQRMQKAVGFRNIAVHVYQDIDWQIVYKIIKENLSDFSEYARCIIEKIEK